MPPDNDITHQGHPFYVATIAAQNAKQAAYKLGGASNIKAGDIAFHRAIIVAAKLSGVGFSVNMQALRELGTNGE